MEERYALLIDADNVSAKYIKPILDELSKYGNVTYKRIYGDWTRPTIPAGKRCFCRTQSHRSSSSAILMGKMRPIRQ